MKVHRSYPGQLAIPVSLAKSEEVTLKAKGLYLFLSTLEDDSTISLEFLSSVLPEGLFAISAAVRELQKAGYLTKTRLRREDGTFFWTWELGANH